MEVPFSSFCAAVVRQSYGVRVGVSAAVSGVGAASHVWRGS